jgi:hypothetical protein
LERGFSNIIKLWILRWNLPGLSRQVLNPVSSVLWTQIGEGQRRADGHVKPEPEPGLMQP